MSAHLCSKAWFVLSLCAFAASPSLANADESLFERDVLPILTKQCLGCHGGLRQKGDLDLRTIEAALKGGSSGPAVKAGDVKNSELWKRVEADEMPPSEKKLSAADKTALRDWIKAGLPTVAKLPRRDDPLLPTGKQHSAKEVAAAIDRHILRGLDDARLKPMPRTDDEAFLRRVYLDLAGCVPTPAQAAAFLDSKDDDRRAKLIDALLESPQFGEQFGRTWREWICPPELPSDANGGAQPHSEAQKFGSWIGARVVAGDDWGKIVREIITVDGEIKNQPQVIFFGLVGEGGGPSAAGSARSIAALFMGAQIQCAECHDDPFRDWAQKDFWALSAFFRRVNGNFGKISEGVTASNKDKKAAAGQGTEIIIPKTAFKNVGTKIQAAFLGGQEFHTDKDEPLRPHFAQWLTAKDNPYFARAFANRMWFYFFARGIVHPVDDLRPLNPPTHPGLLNLLAQEFTASNYDVKHLLRSICNSEAYQRTSKIVPGTSGPAVAALTSAYGRMPMRIMSADVLYDSLRQVYGDPKLDLRGINPKDGNTLGQAATVKDAYLEFLWRFGISEDDATNYTHGIPQMLTMLNHPRLLAGSKALDTFRKKSTSSDEVVEWLYLSTLSRRPTREELAETQAYLQTAPEDYLGVLWTLVNRSEYLLIR